MTENLNAAALPYFRVTTKNEHRPGWGTSVAFVKYVEVEVYDHVIRLDQGLLLWVSR